MNADLCTPLGFQAMGLSSPLSDTLDSLGFETPTPIQERIIPAIQNGEDVVGQAQTGTGKTAAYALPLLDRLAVDVKAPQVLVLTPTRELAIQVAEACRLFAGQQAGVNVLPVFGGQDYGVQIRGLKKGAHLVVGTPGRICDHLRRGTLDLGHLRTVVIDEADEMLRMGFIEDVEWILDQMPASRQVALFSATMPPLIRRIAKKYLNHPVEIRLESHSRGATTIEQWFCLVTPKHKDEVLERILEAETIDGVIVFTRTKTESARVSELLQAAGFRASALNGDLAQTARERTVEQLRRGHLDILVATDVAARGLDVARISHVINYDPPRDGETYVHRIGRTGRAGRKGKAILLLSPRDRRTRNEVERTTRQPIAEMPIPTAKTLNDRRVARFTDEVLATLETAAVADFRAVIEGIVKTHGATPTDVAAALALLLRKDRPLFLDELPPAALPPRTVSPQKQTQNSRKRPAPGRKQKKQHDDVNMERFCVQVGACHGLNPRHLVGAIANEADLSSRFIGRIDIHHDHSTVDLPAGMPKETFQLLRRVRVCNRPLKIRRVQAPTTSLPERSSAMRI